MGLGEDDGTRERSRDDTSVADIAADVIGDKGAAGVPRRAPGEYFGAGAAQEPEPRAGGSRAQGVQVDTRKRDNDRYCYAGSLSIRFPLLTQKPEAEKYYYRRQERGFKQAYRGHGIIEVYLEYGLACGLGAFAMTVGPARHPRHDAF
jgi:hypothetical protein